VKKTQTSWTAQGTAAMRAIESEKPANTRICYDPFARQFVETWFYHLIKLLAGYGERRTHGALTFIVCRCRYFDDYLQQCLQAGTTQVVILGAGLDSRAYRGGLLSGGVKTFEVDHPATQASKLRRLKKVLTTIPTYVTYVPIDFNDETLDKLLVCGFDPSLKTLYVWEGVTQYLRPEAVDGTLDWVRAHAAPGSAVIFDYQDMAELPQTRIRRGHIYALLSRFTGERRDFAIVHSQIEDFLTRRGFTHVVDVNAEQIRQLYCTGSNQGRTVATNYAIVHAEVA
jgi:methyltransferase (TIGR00027 family)